MKPKLTVDSLKQTAILFCTQETIYKNRQLYGVTDGKAVGTYIEKKFIDYLDEHFIFTRGSSASGIDLPDISIMTDIKVTSINQPQSSCPFRSAAQKVFGLGYNLLLFVYDKKDDHNIRTAQLSFVNCSYIEKERTADYTITFRLREMLSDGADKEDIIAYLNDRNLPADEITLNQIAERIISVKPQQGYLTISNALQWRLQYGRIVRLSDEVSGISKLVDRVI